MTNCNADSANDIGLPALLAHIEKMQIRAVCVQSLISAASALVNDHRYHEDVGSLCDLAYQVADELNKGLDAVSLPEVTS